MSQHAIAQDTESLQLSYSSSYSPNILFVSYVSSIIQTVIIPKMICKQKFVFWRFADRASQYIYLSN